MNNQQLNKELEDNEVNVRHISDSNTNYVNDNYDKNIESSKIEKENNELKQKLSDLRLSEKNNVESYNDLKNKYSQLLNERDNLNNIINVHSCVILESKKG